MPKDRKKTMSDGELSEMFLNIGRAKEVAAEGIIAEHRKEEEEKRRQLKERLKIFGGTVEQQPEEDVDYDKEVRALEQEIEWVRSGKIHKYNGVVLTEEDSERPDALEDNPILPEKTKNKPEPEFELEEPADGKPVLELSVEEEPELEVELDGAAAESDYLCAYFATAYDSRKAVGRFVYDIYNGDTLLKSATEEVNSSKAETVVFIGATKMLQYIQDTKCTSALLVMPEEAEDLLRKNVIYGLTGDYGRSAVEYIKKAKELSAECFLRVLSGIHTKEMSDVIRRTQIQQ